MAVTVTMVMVGACVVVAAGTNETGVPDSSVSRKVFIPTNPFTNSASLQALKQSFAKQPNWKAAIKEGTTWEGNADENAAKWRKLNRIDA